MGESTTHMGEVVDPNMCCINGNPFVLYTYAVYLLQENIMIKVQIIECLNKWINGFISLWLESALQIFQKEMFDDKFHTNPFP